MSADHRRVERAGLGQVEPGHEANGRLACAVLGMKIHGAVC